MVKMVKRLGINSRFRSSLNTSVNRATQANQSCSFNPNLDHLESIWTAELPCMVKMVKKLGIN
jgi:hypothetical protein